MAVTRRTGGIVMAAIVTAALSAPNYAQSHAQSYAQQPPAASDPPARVGRIARVSGTVSYHLAGAERWEPATVNLPITTGAAIWTEPGARAELSVPGLRLALDAGSELDTTRLDTQALAATIPQGALYLGLRVLPQGDTVSVETPRGTVAFRTQGQYEVVAGDTTHPTTITVVQGSADVDAAGLTVHVGLNQTATVTGDGASTPFAASLAPASQDAFLTAELAAELAENKQTRPPSVSPPPIVAAMTGGEALDEIGEWQTVPEYGPVWFPPVEAGFVPYRQGRWTWVAPWGWTWIDQAPWGFAPFHYGRWSQFEDRWFWVPGGYGAGVSLRAGVPVYAPALVAFVGGAALAAASAPVVGWFPLGPHDPYVPPYRASLGYVRRFDAFDGVGSTGGSTGRATGRAGLPSFPNRGFATVVPAAQMAAGARIDATLPTRPPASLPASFRPPVQPTGATPGIGPAAARQFGLRPVAQPTAPGPAITPRIVRPGIGPARPPLARVSEPGPGLANAALPNAAAAPPVVARPNLPGLREPNAPGPLQGAQAGRAQAREAQVGGASGPTPAGRPPLPGSEPPTVFRPTGPGASPGIEGPGIERPGIARQEGLGSTPGGAQPPTVFRPDRPVTPVPTERSEPRPAPGFARGPSSGPAPFRPAPGPRPFRPAPGIGAPGLAAPRFGAAPGLRAAAPGFAPPQAAPSPIRTAAAQSPRFTPPPAAPSITRAPPPAAFQSRPAAIPAALSRPAPPPVQPQRAPPPGPHDPHRAPF